jgi:drug/metabolite transporter superfamily protein YnfA
MMSHRSDIIRADILLKYGGIYSDWDVIWLKPIDELISKGYDTILNFDILPRPGSVCGYLSNVLYGNSIALKKKSRDL